MVSDTPSRVATTRAPSSAYAAVTRGKYAAAIEPNGKIASVATAASAITGTARRDNLSRLGRPESAISPITAYATASRNSDRSMPALGSRTNAATSGPTIAPAVLDNVNHPAVDAAPAAT